MICLPSIASIFSLRSLISIFSFLCSLTSTLTSLTSIFSLRSLISVFSILTSLRSLASALVSLMIGLSMPVCPLTWAAMRARRSGRLPMRCVAGRPGSSCWGEPVARSQLRAVAGVISGFPAARSVPWRAPRAPTTMGEALEVPEKRSVYQIRSSPRPAGRRIPCS